MCRGLPHHHPCGHSSVNWNYCPGSKIDVETGYQSTCSKQVFANSQPSSQACPLELCAFDTKGPFWTCCQCGQGPNDKGWCEQEKLRYEFNTFTNTYDMIRQCGHMCCSKCTKIVGPGDPAPSEGPGYKKRRSKGQGSRRHGHGSSRSGAQAAAHG